MNGWAAAIMRMWPRWWMKRVPILPHLLAQSKTGRCSSLRCGAPSTVIVPQMTSFASSICFVVNPSARSRSKPGAAAPRRRCRAGHRLLAERPGVEGERELEGAGQRRLDLLQLVAAEALAQERLAIDVRRAVERQRAHDVVQDRVALVRR